MDLKSENEVTCMGGMTGTGMDFRATSEQMLRCLVTRVATKQNLIVMRAKERNITSLLAQAPSYQLSLFPAENNILRYEDRIMKVRVEGQSLNETHTFDIQFKRPEYVGAEIMRMVISGTNLDNRILKGFRDRLSVNEERLHLTSVNEKELTDYFISLTN